MLQQLNPDNYSSFNPITCEHMQMIIDVLVHMNVCHSDKVACEQIIRNLTKWIDVAGDNNWLKMEIVQSIGNHVTPVILVNVGPTPLRIFIFLYFTTEKLGFYDNRLINTLDICLRTESHGVNALGLRQASVHALQAFKVPPNGNVLPSAENVFYVSMLFCFLTALRLQSLLALCRASMLRNFLGGQVAGMSHGCHIKYH
jgi:hypothetical protein